MRWQEVFESVAVALQPVPPPRVGAVPGQRDRRDPGLDGSGYRPLSRFLQRVAKPRVKAPRDRGRTKLVHRTFSLATTVTPSSLLERARRAARENDAILVGDERSGRFSHEMVKGEYRMVGQTVTVTITHKHWLVPWPMVELQLRTLVQ